MPPAEEEKRRAYLLGLLPEEETARLEEGYFADEAAFEDLVLAEDDLIDEYLDGKLAEDVRRAFEARLAQHPELPARVEARRTLTRALRRKVGAARTFEWDVRRLGRRRVAVGLAAAAAAVFVTVRAMQERPLTPPPTTKVARSSEASLEPPGGVIPPPSVPVVLVLGAAGLREASTVPTAILSPEIPAVRLRLPAERAERKILVVFVEDVDGGRVFTAGGRMMQDGGVGYMEAEIPSSALPAGDYIAKFRGLGGGDREAFFRVRR
jgi:anti-sigma factor RsiW